MKIMSDYINTLEAHLKFYEQGDIPKNDFCRIAKEYIDEIKEQNIIGYDKNGTPLHEGDKITFKIDVSDWASVYKRGLNIDAQNYATLEGIIEYSNGDCAYVVNTEYDYAPSLYLHSIINITKMNNKDYNIDINYDERE